MGRITQLLVSISRKWWGVVLILALNIAAVSILLTLGGRFEAVSGVPTFDTQSDLTVERIREQLPLYQGEAREAYFTFAAFDFVFPFISSLNLAILWALFLRTNSWTFAARLLTWNLPVLALLATLSDWGENISLLAILNAGASPDTALLEVAITFKQLKLFMINGVVGVTVILFVLAAINWIMRVVQHRGKVQLEPSQKLS